ncbi:TPA: hypothetical protein NGW16_005195 [Vibrio parahaemolyticus]|nr:hypothetical protein [Vibrio parahaemolyticus]HCE5000414.1 hypothetical protein [Vibrio parahaemolyticus]
MKSISIEVQKQGNEWKEDIEKSLEIFHENYDINESMGSDGNPSVIIEILNLSKDVLPHILTFTLGYISRNRVKRIVVGEWIIENPTKNMIKIFEEKLKKEMEDDLK